MTNSTQRAWNWSSRCSKAVVPRKRYKVPGSPRMFQVCLRLVYDLLDGFEKLFESWLKYIFEMVFIVFELHLKALLPTGLNFHWHVLTSKHAIFGDKTMVFIMGHIWIIWGEDLDSSGPLPPPGRGRASLLAVRWDKRLRGLEAANCGDSTTIAGGWFNQEKI